MTESDWIQGKLGSALDFDGSNDYISVTTPSVLPTGATDRSMSFWVKSPNMAVSNTYILGWGSDANQDRSAVVMGLGASPSRKIAFWGWNSDLQSTSTLDDDTWYHIVVTVDTGTDVKIYINGVLDNSGTVTAISTPTSTNFEIGDTTGDTMGPFNAAIDDVKIFDYVLSSTQVSYEYNRGKPYGWWKLDECAETTANDHGFGENDGTITIGSGGTNTSAGTCSGSSGEAWNDGAVGKWNASLEFDGNDDTISLGDVDEIDNMTSISGCSWVKHSTITADQSIMSKYASGSDDSFLFVRDEIGSETSRTDTYKIYVADSASSNNAYVEGTQDASVAGAWTHVCFTFEAGSATGLRLYINGKEDQFSPASTSSISAINSSTTPLLIGSHNSGSYFDGQMDDVRIYNYPLSATQVKTIMNEGSAQRFGN